MLEEEGDGGGNKEVPHLFEFGSKSNLSYFIQMFSELAVPVL